MGLGKGILTGHLVTLRRFFRTFFVGSGATLRRRGGGDLAVDLWTPVPAGTPPPSTFRTPAPRASSPSNTPTNASRSASGSASSPCCVYDDADGYVRCTSCNICAKVCPPQCIWMIHARGPDGNPVPMPEDFYIDMDVCMNCGFCSEYCPFDAIKMDQNFELSNYERHQSHIYSLQDLLVSSDYYAQTHPEAWSSQDEITERDKVAKKKDQRLKSGRRSRQGS